MQPGSKRVKWIYSVIASPNRLEILRILNTRGPLSYSDLKMMAGFKSKKESGKFAYHLRKLVRVTLVSLNRSERKYVVTSLGRLILNQARQLEEQSMMESGRLYVRTSRQSMEEFNADKILQSLVRESGMPLELAQRITSEAEQRLYKFQTNYLTGPLIRELVNALLVEHGLEGYRHKLTRLGLPVYDVTQLIERAGSSNQGLDHLVESTARAVLSEYLLLDRLSKDVADAHLNGDIHISRAGLWGLKPDSVFVDAETLTDFTLKGKLLHAPRLKPPQDLDGALALLTHAAILLSKEVAVEACFEHVVPYLARFDNGSDSDPTKSFRRAFVDMGIASLRGGDEGFISLAVGNGGAKQGPSEHLLDPLLQAYGDYAEATPDPKIRLIYQPSGDSAPTPEPIARLIARGVPVAFSNGIGTHSYIGLAKTILPNEIASGFPVLHSLSINLPRLSYESSKDDVYFKAKLAIQLQLCVEALDTRRRMLQESFRKGLTPILATNPSIVSADSLPVVINLLGLDESLTELAGDRAPTPAKNKMAQSIIQSAIKVSADRGQKAGQTLAVSILADPAASRFAIMDSDRFGRAGILPQGERRVYSHGGAVSFGQLQDGEAIQHLSQMSTQLNGGFDMSIIPERSLSSEELLEHIAEANRLFTFYRIEPKITICRSCGTKVVGHVGRCKTCRSTSQIRLPEVENRPET